MSLAAINSQYLGLNGLCGLGGYGAYSSGIYSGTNMDGVKDSITNGYEISAMSSSYGNKANVLSSSFNQQAQAIQYLIQQGRVDDAMDKYKALYDDMAQNPYYQGYGENEIKTLIQENYIKATGTTLVNDIESNVSSDFITGFKSAIPVVGFLDDANSKDDFIAKVTGTPVAGESKVKNAAGILAGAAVSAGVAAGARKIYETVRSTSGSSRAKLFAGIAATVGVLTGILGKVIKDKN